MTLTCLLRCSFYWKEYYFYFMIMSGTTLSSLPNITQLANLGTSPAIYWIGHWELIMMWQVDKLVLIIMWRIDKLVLIMMWRVDKLVLIMMWQVDKLVLIMTWRSNYPKQKKKRKKKRNYYYLRGRSPFFEGGGGKKGPRRGFETRDPHRDLPLNPSSQQSKQGFASNPNLSNWPRSWVL